MPTTSNFGWNTPADTDLVKDGAAAIRTLGNNIDASLVDLKGGTTGQVLAKATNTDLDFTWVAQDDSNAIQNAIVDAKGDLITATAADTPARLAVGTNGQYLQADSTAATGLKWVTLATGANENWVQVATGSLTGGAVNVSGLTTYDKYIVVAYDISCLTSDDTFRIRFNGGAASNYRTLGSNGGSNVNFTNQAFSLGIGAAVTTGNIFFSVSGCRSTTDFKRYDGVGFRSSATTGLASMGGVYSSITAITEINLQMAANDFDNGTYFVYGSN